jgi:hypothetical protein
MEVRKFEYFRWTQPRLFTLIRMALSGSQIFHGSAQTNRRRACKSSRCCEHMGHLRPEEHALR